MGIRQHPQVRSDSAGPAWGRAACRETGARPEDPEGGVPTWVAGQPPVAAREARCAAAPAAAREGGTPCAPGGWWSAACWARVRGVILQVAQDLQLSEDEKAGEQGTLVAICHDSVQLVHECVPRER